MQLPMCLLEVNGPHLHQLAAHYKWYSGIIEALLGVMLLVRSQLCSVTKTKETHSTLRRVHDSGFTGAVLWRLRPSSLRPPGGSAQ